MLVKPQRAFVSDVDRADFVAHLNAATGAHLALSRPLALGWLLLIDNGVDDDDGTAALVDGVRKVDGVAKASVDRVAHLSRLPSDPFLDFMWHVEAMRLPAAWDVTVGSPSVRVGVVDSGIVGHEDIDDNFGFGIDFISDAAVSNDGDGRDSNAFDDAGGDTDFHGTHVAGTVAADGDNDIGVVGGSWRATLEVVRALGVGGSGFASDIGEGAFWLGGGEVPGVDALASNQRVQVVNLSLGSESTECDAFYEDIFQSLDDAGVVVVVAAGNSAGPVESPANCPSALAVAATGPDDSLASYSCFGTEIDIVAPGGDQVNALEDGVLSSSGLSDFDNGAPYAFLQGTSMATPNISGVVALLKSLDSSLTRAEVAAILQQTGRGCGGCGGKFLVDAGAAVAFVADGGSVDVPSCDNTCQFADDGECDDGRPGAVSAACGSGTDCNDCGGGGGGPACNDDNNGCQFANDDVCDEDNGVGACPDGSDGADCGACVVDNGGGGGDDNGNGNGNDDGLPTCTESDNSCYPFDGACDEEGSDAVCDAGTDAFDCGRCDDVNQLKDSLGPSLCGQGALPLTSALSALLWTRRRRRANLRQ